MNHLTVANSVLRYVARLPATTHAVFCYEDTETARQVLMSYLNEAVHILSYSRESLDLFLQSIKLYKPFAEERINASR
jgi:hypothetical protein